jgi:hypothetical protein
MQRIAADFGMNVLLYLWFYFFARRSFFSTSKFQEIYTKIKIVQKIILISKNLLGRNSGRNFFTNKYSNFLKFLYYL